MPIQDQATAKSLARRGWQIPRPVQVRRRTDVRIVTELNGASIPTASYGYGVTTDLSEYSEILVEVFSASLVLGSGAGLKAQIELLNPRLGTYFAVPATGNPTAALTPVAGSATITSFVLSGLPLHMIRVGLICTTAFTSGTVGVALHLRG